MDNDKVTLTLSLDDASVVAIQLSQARDSLIRDLKWLAPRAHARTVARYTFENKLRARRAVDVALDKLNGSLWPDDYHVGPSRSDRERFGSNQ